MQVIWKQGASERRVPCSSASSSSWPTPPSRPCSTSSTEKESSGARLRGRAYEYSATVSEAKASSHAVRDLVDRMFGGSPEELVMSLIKSRQIDAKQIARLTRKLEAEEDEGGER